ncbi:MAG: acyl-CoA transferase/carnitine dehydratase [Nocardioides sp.]|nr:acyl-CoA transferase/carnitine dehydratase [Nocardioides sp.]
MTETGPITSPNPVSALAGVRVIDAATLAAGPLAGTYLAELGAEVIKLEQPGEGDPLRNWGSQRNGTGLMWKSVARNKLTATINLRVPEGQDLLRRLASVADVLILNARPSTLARWGLDYPRLAEANPGLVVLHVTGFGAGGPASDKPGFGTLGEAMSGFAHTTGERDGPPTLPQFMLADGVASLSGTYAVLAALYHRDCHGGTGQLIDLSLVEPLARLLEQSILTFDQLGTIDARTGNKWPITVPRNTYQTNDGDWIALSGSTPSLALRVYRAIGRPELADDPAYADPQQRLQHADEIDDLVAAWVAERSLDDAMAEFDAWGVAAAPVYDAPKLLADPHLTARGTYVSLPDDDLERMTVQGPVPRLSATPARVDHLGRALGADNAYVYDLIGLDETDLLDLRNKGVI